jgi:hypothetical protein
MKTHTIKELAGQRFVILGFYYQVFLGGAFTNGTHNGALVRLAESRTLIPTIKFILGYAW